MLFSSCKRSLMYAALASPAIPDAEARERLIPTAIEVVRDEKQLAMLGKNIELLAQHRSAERIVDEIVNIIDK